MRKAGGKGTSRVKHESMTSSGKLFRPRPRVQAIGGLMPNVQYRGGSKAGHVSAGGRRIDANKLDYDAGFFDGKEEEINKLLNDLNFPPAVLDNKEFEIELRLLYDSGPDNSDRFNRVREFLQNDHRSRTGQTIEPVTWDQYKFDFPIGGFRMGFTANYIWRGPNNAYIKVKKTDKMSINLPAVVGVKPRIGVSVESLSYRYDRDPESNPLAAQPSSSVHTRWSFPINSQMIPSQDPFVTTMGINGRIDLTIIDDKDEPAKPRTYSIEIELESAPLGISDSESGRLNVTQAQLSFLDYWAKIIIPIISKSGTFMTLYEKEEVEVEFNRILGIREDTISSHIINQPKDLQKYDLSWLSPEKSDLFMRSGNYDESDDSNRRYFKTAFSGDVHIPLMSIPGGYSVSMKADGTRYFIFFDKRGIFVINARKGIVTKISGDGTQSPFIRNIIPGTILDVEIIGEFGPAGTLERYDILVFDILAKSSVDIRSQTYPNRLTQITELIDLLHKPGYISDIVSDHEKKYKETIQASVESNEPQIPITLPRMVTFDELMRIEVKPVYRLPALVDVSSDNMTDTEKVLRMKQLSNEFFAMMTDLTNRVISSNSHSQVLVDGEWKDTEPQKTNGIEWYSDGLIFTPTDRPYLENGDTYLQINTRKRGRPDKNFSLVRKWKPVLTIDFKVGKNRSGNLTLLSYDEDTSSEIQFSDYNNPWNGNVELDETMEGKIVEFRWGYSTAFLDYAFIKFRVRDDKPTGNTLSTAVSTWKLINDPITPDDLSGSTLTLMRRYHNRVKTYLLSELSSKLGGKGVLMDIGSGGGGDFEKWRQKFLKVYAVEPDIRNIRQFISRTQRRRDFDYTNISGKGIVEEVIRSVEPEVKSEATVGARIGSLMGIASMGPPPSVLTPALIREPSSILGPTPIGKPPAVLGPAIPEKSNTILISHYSKMKLVHARSELPSDQQAGRARQATSNTGSTIPTKTANKFSESAYVPKVSKYKTIVNPINARGEDIDALTTASVSGVNCVTMFNALTFFYESRDKLQGLINSVKSFLIEGGYFYVMCLDGELLLNSMRTSPTYDVEPSTSNIDLSIDNNSDTNVVPTVNLFQTNNLIIAKSPDSSCRKIWIRIEESIVRGQFEYLVNTKEFTKIMDLNGFRLTDERYLNEETLLSDEQYWFSSMFKVMQFRFFSNPNKRELGIYLNPIIKNMEMNRVLEPLEPMGLPAYINSTQLGNMGIRNLVRIGAPQDGSCYIHAILNAFSKTYRAMDVSQTNGFVTQLRKELSANFTEEIYRSIGDGFFLTSNTPAFTYENIKAALADLTFWVPQYLMGFIGDQLKTNVYILRGVDAEVYKFGGASGHVVPGRKNVVLYWINDNHYETVGILEGNDNVRTVFADNHPLIQAFHTIDKAN